MNKTSELGSINPKLSLTPQQQTYLLPTSKTCIRKKNGFRGQLFHEVEINAPANEVWDLCSTLELAKLAHRELKDVIEKIEVVEGDGGVGTVLKLTFVPGFPGFSSYKEKFTKIDHENRVKEAEVVEAGYLDLGFTLYRVRFGIEERGEASCVVKTTVEYEIKEESAANESLVSIQALANIAEIAKKHLTQNKA